MFPVSYVAEEIQLGDITPKTILQVYGDTNSGRSMIREISLTVNDVPDLSKSILVKVVRQSTAGSGLITVTGEKVNSDDSLTIRTSGLSGKDTGQTDPTTGNSIMAKYIPTLGGEFFWLAIRETDKLPLNNGDRIGIVVESALTELYKVSAHIILEE